MQNKKTKLRGCNILFGILVVLGLSVGPAAFDIRLHRGVLSRRSLTRVSSRNNHVSKIFSGNGNLLTKVQARPPSQTPSKPTSRNEFPWLTVLLMLLVGKLAALTSSINPSLMGAGATNTLKGPRKSILGPTFLQNRLQQQVTILGPSYAFIRLLNFHASSISSWYMGLLAWSPLFTKTVTTATIGVLGDTTAQYIETRVQESSPRESPKVADDPERKSNCVGAYDNNESWLSWLENYDRRRGMSVFGENILVSGPLLHFAYNTMEALLPTTFGGRSAIFAAIGHALLDTFVLDTIFLAIMFVTTGIAEGYVREIIPQFRKDFVPTLKIGWVTGLCFLPIQFVLFRFFPLRLRVLGVNLIDVFWEAYISYMVHRRRRNTGNAQSQ